MDSEALYLGTVLLVAVGFLLLVAILAWKYRGHPEGVLHNLARPSKRDIENAREQIRRLKGESPPSRESLWQQRVVEALAGGLGWLFVVLIVAVYLAFLIWPLWEFWSMPTDKQIVGLLGAIVALLLLIIAKMSRR